MPPKKKHTHKARKAELVFLERPREGPVQCCEAPLHSAENPRRVPTKPVDGNTSAAWVSPQFETTEPVVLKAHQKKHRGPHKSQNHDANHNLLHAGGACRRAVACKFPPLTFENIGHAVHLPDHPHGSGKTRQCSHSQPKKGTAANTNIQVKSLENCGEIPLLPTPQPVEREVLSLLDAEAGQEPSLKNWICSNTLSHGSPAWHPEKELAFDTEPCGRAVPAAVLVTDTPEHEYGVKVTWRQRPRLMKYLMARG
ncbi:RAD9, HUS1, RAD1-interacting nuclear orphan protein 1, partial [Acanthisitta chloris]